MSTAPDPPRSSTRVRVVIPRWVQLSGLPLLIVFAWIAGSAVSHTLFLFMIAALIALLLDPVVLALGRVGIRRSLSVAAVYLTFAALIVVAIVAVATVVVSHTKTAAKSFNEYFTAPHGRSHLTSADRDVDRLQHWLDDHHLRSIKIEAEGHTLVRKIRARDIGHYTGKIVHFVEGAAISIGETLFDAVLVLVISIYMLLDMQRLSRRVNRRFPPGDGRPLISRIEHSLAAYVRGQFLLSLIVGTSAGFGLWVFGATGLLPHETDAYALLFGAWAGLTEVLPYLGPWLGGIPPAIYALVVHPFSVIWVIILFLAIQEAEGHFIVPKVMGSALRLHPLLVIFGLLAGSNIDGLVGALVALPILACGRAIWEFFAERVVFDRWAAAAPLPVEVELELPGGGSGPPAAAPP